MRECSLTTVLQVLNALEELAVTYDAKVAEAERLQRENDNMTELQNKVAQDLEVSSLYSLVSSLEATKNK